MKSDEEALLSVEKLEVVYHKVSVAVQGVSFEVGRNRIVALLGTNGAGKTTTLRAISGFLGIDDASVTALLNSMFPSMKDVVDKLAEAGLRDRVKVIIGGSPCNEEVRRFTGADYYVKDAAEGARICKEVYATQRA